MPARVGLAQGWGSTPLGLACPVGHQNPNLWRDSSLRGQTKRSSNNSHLCVYVSAVGYQIRRPPNPILLHRFRSISIRLVFLMGHGKLAGHPLPPAPQQQGFQGLGDRPRRTHLTDPPPPPPGPRQGAMLTI